MKCDNLKGWMGYADTPRQQEYLLRKKDIQQQPQTKKNISFQGRSVTSRTPLTQATGFYSSRIF